MRPGDQGERDRVLASARNLAVTAGAGTGKTTLLVDKIVHKVVVEGLPLENLLALTFTEKAATELRERLRRRLGDEGRAAALDRAEIGTIHSFCAHVLRRFPVEAGVAPDFRVDEGAVFRVRFERAWPRWLDRELGSAARRPRAWKAVLSRVDLGTLRELAWGLSSFGVPLDEPGDGAATLREFAREAALAAPALADALAGKAPVPARPRAGASPREKSAWRLAQDMASIDEELVGRAVALVSEFAREFRGDYLRAGYVTFDAMLSLVYELLSNPEFPEVLEFLRNRYRFILVDEFQDTDPLQGAILQKLAEGPDGRLVPGRILVVGDPKQSIYSFRGADIVAYHRFVDRILEEGGERAALRTNFRSHGRILSLVNDVFGRLIAPHRQLQPTYEPVECPEGRAPAFPEPTIEAILIEDAGAEEAREAEAEAIAGWIASRRDVRYRDVAILLRALSDVNLYLEALRGRGIPYVIEGEKYFYGTPEVVDFVNLLRAVAYPHDRVALAAVLRSPYGALSDQELYARRRELDYRRASDLPLFGFLRRWNEEAGRRGVAELIDLIFEESYALEIARAGYHGEQAVANLLKLRRKAADFEAQEGGTLREFLVRAGRAIRELEEEGESPLADETLDAVRVLSIHRAKGLEFPVVFLPDLHREFGGSRGEPVVRYDWPTRTRGIRLGAVCDAGGAALSWLDRERRREELRRILYVGMTRAREILVLTGGVRAKGETYLSMLLPDLDRHARVTRVPYRRPALAAPPAPAEPERPDFEGLAARWRARERRASLSERFTSPTRLEEASEGEPRAPAEAAIEIGRACHRVLETLDFSRPEVPEGVPPEAARILERFFRSEAFQELASSEILARELPFLLPRGGQVVQGVLDVVYRKNGILYVGDYKTDKMLEPGAYELIRDLYTEAARRIFPGTRPRFRLIDLRRGRMVEVEAARPSGGGA
jgi:ATP-dependent helicase/nuclease subunit A